MVVITGIIELIKAAIRVAPIVYKGSKIVYKGVKQTKRGAKWIGRNPKYVRAGTIAATSAPIIYDLLNIDYSAIQKTLRTPAKQQTRGYLQSSRTRQFRKSDCRPRYRYRRSR